MKGITHAFHIVKRPHKGPGGVSKCPKWLLPIRIPSPSLYISFLPHPASVPHILRGTIQTSSVPSLPSPMQNWAEYINKTGGAWNLLRKKKKSVSHIWRGLTPHAFSYRKKKPHKGTWWLSRSDRFPKRNTSPSLSFLPHQSPWPQIGWGTILTWRCAQLPPEYVSWEITDWSLWHCADSVCSIFHIWPQGREGGLSR